MNYSINNSKTRALVVSIVTLMAATSGVTARALFADAKLADFNQVGNANWNSVDSEIQANQGSGFLVTKETYDHFYLRVEFQAGKATNSGIFIRCADAGKITDKTCYEVNIFDTRPDPIFRTGAITGYVSPKALLNTEDGSWHTYEIYAAGEKFRVILDGKETAYMRNPALSSGYVALQLAQGEIKFRNFEIRRISSDELESKKTAQPLYALSRNDWFLVVLH